MFYSPLRYPGGKNKLSSFIAKICIENQVNGHYVEPYSGGASVALFLLIQGFVKEITINDKDRSIYAFWFSVLNYTDELCLLIENSQITPNEWYIQKEVQKKKETSDILSLGFSTFYLNRTNRSGIIEGGLMGGKSQNGTYLMNCRFNKHELIQRIKLIASFKERINLFNEDAVTLIDIISAKQDENVIFYFDPPYFLKASTLYLNHYKYNDHRAVSEKIKSIKNFKWIVSYDNVQEIRSLFSNCISKEFSFKHTAFKSRDGKEILFFSDNLQISILDKNPTGFKFDLKKNKIVYKEKKIIS